MPAYCLGKRGARRVRRTVLQAKAAKAVYYLELFPKEKKVVVGFLNDSILGHKVVVGSRKKVALFSHPSQNVMLMSQKNLNASFIDGSSKISSYNNIIMIITLFFSYLVVLIGWFVGG